MVSATMKLILKTAITMALTVALLLSTQKLALLVIAMVSLIVDVFLGSTDQGYPSCFYFRNWNQKIKINVVPSIF